MNEHLLLQEALEREQSYMQQIKFLREEKEQLEAERNKYRSQALMRQNRIDELSRKLNALQLQVGI